MTNTKKGREINLTYFEKTGQFKNFGNKYKPPFDPMKQKRKL